MRAQRTGLAKRRAPRHATRPLFVTRKFPPSVGGMETLAVGVWRTLSDAYPGARIIAHGGPNSQLPRWLPLAVLRTTLAILRRQVDFVLTNDALTFSVVRPILWLTRTPGAAMVMGLDLTFENPLYRFMVRRTLPGATVVVAISEATAQVAERIGVAPHRIHVVRLGVDTPEAGPAEREAAARKLRAELGVGEDATVLLTLGRLVRRKGARWFVAEVLPRLERELQHDVVYAIAGDGPEAEPIAAAAQQAGVGGRVRLLGRVDDDERELLMRGADLFVQPNVPVPGDMEGFGLVVIEAVLRGTPVVGAAMEGILDAIVDGETGLLVTPADADAWVATLRDLLADRAALARQGAQFQDAARDIYSHRRMARDLVAALGLGS